MLRLFLIFSHFFTLTAVACPSDRIIPNEYLIRVRTGAVDSASQKASSNLLQQHLQTADTVKSIYSASTDRVQSQKISAADTLPDLLFVKSSTLENDREEILQDPSVLSIEPNCRYELQATPNDPLFAQQWHHALIGSTEAWNIFSGTTNITVAVSDTGVDINHPDLQSQLWTNTAEANGVAGVDDDNNGCVDDIHGCDLADNDGDPRPGSASNSEHGTHVAGLVAAAGNNAVGTTGMIWSTRLMAIKGFPDNDSGAAMSDLVQTVYYAANNGARVLNCSWGIQSSPSQAERDAFTYARSRNMVVIVASGNSAIDANDFSPASLSNVITVGASTSQEQLASYSNYGSPVDILAPGGESTFTGGALNENILSTFPTNKGSYGSLRGTSMAAPLVAGTAALILSINPNLTVGDVERILIDSGDLIDVHNLANAQFTYPRLNAFRAAQMALVTLGGAAPGGGDNSSQDLSSEVGNLASKLSLGMGGCGMTSTNTASLSATTDVYWMMLIVALPLLLCSGFRFVAVARIRKKR